MNKKLGVIGYGNMAQAIIAGALKSKKLKTDDMLICDNDKDKLKKASNGGMAVCSNPALVSDCKYILLAVKPQSAPEIFKILRGKVCGNIIISILAGAQKEYIKSGTGCASVCRCMPNTPLLLGRGVTGIDADDLTAADAKFVRGIFSASGSVISLSEDRMNAITAVSGSGPAFVYTFINDYINAAMNRGFTYAEAKMLVCGTVDGSLAMVSSSDEPIENLIDRVCSKGGTTIEGVNVLKNRKFKEIIGECVDAAYKRAEELSKK